MPPDLLIDRSLGGIAVPSFFRQAWPAQVHTLDDVFGSGKVEDALWMAHADQAGWIAVCKDDRIRRRVGERLLMSQGSLRVFCLTNGQLLRDEMVDRFARALPEMLAVVNEPAPWMYGVYSDHIELLTLYG